MCKITVDRDHYEDLIKNNFLLQCLQDAGVDNWDGHYYAMQEFWKQYPDE